MQLSAHQKRRKEYEKKKALAMYRQGFSTRTVSLMLKELGINRSHTWVADLVRERGERKRLST